MVTDDKDFAPASDERSWAQKNIWVLVVILAITGCLVAFGLAFSASYRKVHHLRATVALTQASKAIQQYAADFDDRYPPSANWETSIEAASQEPWRPASLRNMLEDGTGIGFNSLLGRADLNSIEAPENTVELFVSTSVTKDTHGGEELMWRDSSGSPAFVYCNGEATRYGEKLADYQFAP